MAGARVADLPFGTQKRVELARALASDPKLLLLDEPASGLKHEEVGELGVLIREIRDRLGLTVLLVERHMSLVMRFRTEWWRSISAARSPKARPGGAEAPRGDPGQPGDGVMAALLEVSKLHAAYGMTRVLHGISFAMEDGSITTLLGANGAGKTTTLRALCQMVKTQGEIRFAGERMDGKATEDIVRFDSKD